LAPAVYIKESNKLTPPVDTVATSTLALKKLTAVGVDTADGNPFPS
jgi:hypothetical protein